MHLPLPPQCTIFSKGNSYEVLIVMMLWQSEAVVPGDESEPRTTLQRDWRTTAAAAASSHWGWGACHTGQGTNDWGTAGWTAHTRTGQTATATLSWLHSISRGWNLEAGGHVVRQSVQGDPLLSKIGDLRRAPAKNDSSITYCINRCQWAPRYSILYGFCRLCSVAVFGQAILEGCR